MRFVADKWKLVIKCWLQSKTLIPNLCLIFGMFIFLESMESQTISGQKRANGFNE